MTARWLITPPSGAPERAPGPDFALIGWKKTGTTSLMSWLGEHPGVHPPRVKEPAYFSHHGRSWHRYRRQLGAPGAAPGQLLGDGSTSYGDPHYASRSARRIAAEAPSARLIAIHRDPFARLWSHYRHEVRRGRRPAVPFSRVAADLDLDDVVVRSSRYRLGIEPYLALHPGPILLLETERLREQGWARTLAFLDLAPMPLPATDRNVGDEAVTYRFHRHRLMRVLNRVRPYVPAPLARLTRPLVVRDDDARAERLEPVDVEALLAPEVAAVLREEHAWIRARTGVAR